MPRLSTHERLLKDIIDDPTRSEEERLKAGEEREKIKRRQTRLKIGVVNRHKKKGCDPKPEFNEDEGYPAFWEKLAAWEQRHPEVKSAPAPVAKIEQPKPEPVIAAPIEPEPAKIAPPKRIARPAPAPVVRKAREGHSGKFFKEVFYDLPIFERNMILKTLNPAQQAEWEQIETNRALEAARVMASMPKETPKPVSEAEKAAAFAPPIMIEPRATGQPQTVDEVRETFGPTMGNATPDSGLSPELDRRGWLPDTPAKELPPSR
jgi:hypothetical protein